MGVRVKIHKLGVKWVVIANGAIAYVAWNKSGFGFDECRDFIASHAGGGW